VVTERPDHSRLVSTGTHTGYLQRAVSHNGHTYIQRTYVDGHQRVSRVYTSYRYHGVTLDHFVPRYFYAPEFYGWAYYAWDAPAAYTWGWAGSPWLANYRGYFSPWNADYYLGQTLADGYDMQAGTDDGQQADDAAQNPGDEAYAQTDTPITPEIKQAIAEEVQQQLAYENAAATQPDQAPTLDDLPQVLTPGHVFVADEGLNVSTADGQACGLSAGNVLRLVTAPADGSPAADLIVVSSRRADCPAGVQVTLSLQSLQEMQNNFRSQLDSGLQALREQQGHGGLPGAPYSAIAPPPRPADDVPVDSENVQALLQTQQQQANQAETSVTQVAFATNP
jgi:hypothetical protein